MLENIDIFDANYVRIGALERSVVHKLGLWHQTFHCWITGMRNDYKFMVLQLRSAAKKNYPNMLDITAAGHLETNETPLNGVREVEEELGVIINPQVLRSLGVKHDVADEPNGIRNREFANVFLLRDDRDIELYTLQEDEVSGLVEVEIAQGLSLFNDDIESIKCKATRIEDGKIVTFIRDVRKTDLIPRVDNYYLKIFIMAELMLAGNKYLSI